MNSSKFRTFIRISAIVGIVIFFHYLGWLRPFEQLLRNIVNPASQSLHNVSVTIGGQDEFFATGDQLLAAYRDTKKRLTDISVDYAKQTLMEQENTTLREQLHFLTKHSYPSVGAEVIGKNIEPLGSTVVVNRGASAGVAVGNPVITGEGVIVGRVMRVEDSLAVVELINDQQSKLIATTLNTDKSIGVVEGGYGISVRLNFVPQNETLHIGDIIVTSGLEDMIPRGLLIGSIEAIEKEAYQPFQRAIITPSALLDKLTVVSIITGKGDVL